MGATYNCKALYKVKVRPDPSTANATDQSLLAGQTFQISEIVPDRLDPTNTAKKWGHIFGGPYDGKYTALEYPSNPVPISTYTKIEPTPETDPIPDPVKEKIEELTVVYRYGDGTTETEDFIRKPVS